VNIVATGTGGFLGWHARVLLHSLGRDDLAPLPVGATHDAEGAAAAISGAERVLHLAGVNRGTDDEVFGGNVLFAEQLARAVRAAATPPQVLVFANSVQVGSDSPYGRGKLRAAEILAEAASAVGAEFVDLQLPNLFGEHGRPFYNSVTATFCHLLSRGEVPTVEVDRELTLLHAQYAAAVLVGVSTVTEMAGRTQSRTVSGLLTRLRAFASAYGTGDLPDLVDEFDRDLFNTYRSFAFEVQPSHALTQNTDARGSFTEVVRAAGGGGQTSFSTTVPGVTRGQHYHRRKIERFTVVDGTATITLRRLFHDEVVSLPVSGATPVAVDMPTMWAHAITNDGDTMLTTLFWADEVFDPAAPDTVPETV
jgi:UDP-2-acetamido-2,6-beta-L-arabino-hexul-4-ose reductase